MVGAFTTNRVQAAPVLVSKRNIKSGYCSAVIINSGCANACTGEKGLRDAEAMVAETAKALGVPKGQVLVCSTGKIGMGLPVKRILRNLPRLIRSVRPDRLGRAARAILTTDKGPKVASERFRIGRRTIRIVGIAKGAGMIEPHMATMLAFFMTDARIGRRAADAIFRRCLDRTFHRITIDGDTSTNDTALFLAGGRAGGPPIREGSQSASQLETALGRVMECLALRIVREGEGVTKLIRLEVRGARSDREARKAAFAIANSPLVKCAFHGGDPNWGRVLAAAGRSGATLDPPRADIFYNGVVVVRQGVSSGAGAEERARKVMKRDDFSVTVDLNLGEGSSMVWTSDLSPGYVRFNSCYRT